MLPDDERERERRAYYIDPFVPSTPHIRGLPASMDRTILPPNGSRCWSPRL